MADSVEAQWEIASAQGPQPYDAENKGMQLLVAHFSAPASGQVSWSVGRSIEPIAKRL